MAFAINQNFDLKSKRKDFVRQELALADLKNTVDSHYPDDYTVTIGGKIYIFNSSNSVDSTLGRWREFAGGGGGSITPGSGLENVSETLRVKISSGITFDSNGAVTVNCPHVADDSVKTTEFFPVKIGSSSTLGIRLGTALQIETGDKLNIKVNPNSVLEVADQGLVIRIGSGLRNDQGALRLGTCRVFKRNAIGNMDLLADDAVIIGTNEEIALKLGTGLTVDGSGCLCVSDTADIGISTGLARDSEGRLYVDVNAIINA